MVGGRASSKPRKGPVVPWTDSTTLVSGSVQFPAADLGEACASSSPGTKPVQTRRSLGKRPRPATVLGARSRRRRRRNIWSRRQVGSTALAPSKAPRPAALLDDEFDPRRLVRHPVTVLDLGRSGIHLIANIEPKRDRDHWLGIEENGVLVWSKVVLRTLSEPVLGTFLARYSFVGSCPYELIRRAILGRPTAPKRDKEPGRA